MRLGATRNARADGEPAVRPEKIKVLFIGGYLRVGSTLLDRALGQTPGFISVGELRHVWEESFVEDQPCGCGAPFSECGFWREVVEEAYGAEHPLNAREAASLKRRVDRIRYIPQLASFWKSPGYEKDLEAHSRNLSGLYAAIHRVAGGGVIVDSSKDASHAFALANLDGIDLHVAHLVRDSRAVSHSWLRKKVKYEVVGREQDYMDLRGPAASSVGWVRSNLLVEPLRIYASSYTRVRYEDFVAEPRSTLRRLLRAVGEDREPTLAGEHKLWLGVDHTVAGNPNRFRRGDIELRLDEEWKERMSRADQLTATAMTWPLLLRYGYLKGRAYPGSNRPRMPGARRIRQSLPRQRSKPE